MSNIYGLPPHIMRPQRTAQSTKSLISGAQAGSLAQRDIEITLPTPPWQREKVNQEEELAND